MSFTFLRLIEQPYSQHTLYPYFTVDERFTIANTSRQCLSWIKASTICIETTAYNNLNGRIKDIFPEFDHPLHFTITESSSLTEIDIAVYRVYLKFYETFLEKLRLLNKEMPVAKVVVGSVSWMEELRLTFPELQISSPSIVKMNDYIEALLEIIASYRDLDSSQPLETTCSRIRNLMKKDSKEFKLRELCLNNKLNTAFIAQFFATYPTFSQIDEKWNPKRYRNYGFLCLTQSFILSNQKEKANRLIQKYESIIQKDELLFGMVDAYVDKREFAEAEKIIDQMTDQTMKDRALKLICLCHLQKEQFQQNKTQPFIKDPQQLQQTFTLALSIQDSKLQVSVLCYLFENYLRIANVDKAREVAKSICDKRPYRDILTPIYQQYLNQKMFQDALGIVRCMEVKGISYVLISNFQDFLEKDRFDEAHEVAKLITQEQPRNVNSSIVSFYLKKNQFDKALEIAKLTPREFHTFDIIKAFLDKDRFGEANEMVKLITDNSYKVEVIENYLEKARFDEACEMAKLITNDALRSRIVKAFLKKNQFDKAHEIAKLITGDYYKEEVIKNYLEKDRFNEAHEIAKLITHDVFKFYICRSYLKKDRFAEFREIVASIEDTSYSLGLLMSVFLDYIERDNLAEAESTVKLMPFSLIKLYAIAALSKQSLIKESTSKTVVTAWKLSSKFVLSRLFLGPIAVSISLGVCLYHWTRLILSKAKKIVQTTSVYVQEKFRTMIHSFKLYINPLNGKRVVYKI